MIQGKDAKAIWGTILDILIHHNLNYEYECPVNYIICHSPGLRKMEINLHFKKDKLLMRLFFIIDKAKDCIIFQDYIDLEKAGLIAAHSIRGNKRCKYCVIRTNEEK